MHKAVAEVDSELDTVVGALLLTELEALLDTVLVALLLAELGSLLDDTTEVALLLAELDALLETLENAEKAEVVETRVVTPDEADEVVVRGARVKTDQVELELEDDTLDELDELVTVEDEALVEALEEADELLDVVMLPWVATAEVDETWEVVDAMLEVDALDDLVEEVETDEEVFDEDVETAVMLLLLVQFQQIQVRDAWCQLKSRCLIGSLDSKLTQMKPP